jgi:hypothetical protein
MAVTSNMPPQDIFPRFEYLTKLMVFKWLYHYDNHRLRPFSQVTVPADSMNAFREQYLQTKNIYVTHYIFDNQLCRHVANSVNYLKFIQILNKKDIQDIKEDMFRFLDYLENLAVSGVFEETGNKAYIYISDVDITASYAYLRAKNMYFSMIKTFILTSATSMEEETFKRMKNWIQSTIKNSILITVANEKQRIIYFENQRKIVNGLE